MKRGAMPVNVGSVMAALQNIVYFIVFLGVLVTVHEAGHFFAAKWAGVKVLKFSIGFGPKLFSFRRGETEYQVAVLPLGGFVAMAGQNPGEELDEADVGRSFLASPWWKRMFILSAGPAANLVFPFFAFFVAFIGDHQVVAPRVGSLELGYPAASAGMLPGDIITKVDGKAIRAFEEIGPTLDGVFDRPVPITVDRGGRELVLAVTPKKGVKATPSEKRQRGFLGISPVTRPAIVGVAEGSPARAAGLQTFDRILTIGGQATRDELDLLKVVDRLSGRLEVVAVRSHLREAGGVKVVVPEVVRVELEKQAGAGLKSLGVESADLYVWTVLPESPAAKAGVKPGDRLVSVDGLEITSWLTLNQAIQATDAKRIELGWRTASSERRSATVSLIMADSLEEFDLGVRQRQAFYSAEREALAKVPDPSLVTVHMGPGDAALAAAKAVPESVRAIALVMGKLFTREIPLDTVGGPILLAQLAARSAEEGYQTFLKTMAVVSVNLALVNLLPIPVLDGFGLLTAAWEGIRRRPIPARAREVATIIGLVMLALLFVLANKNDITRLLR